MSDPQASLLDGPTRTATGRPVVWAVGLGVLAGFIAGPNVPFAAALLAVVVLNLPLPWFAASLLASLAAAYALTPVFYGVGQRLLDQTAFGAALARAGDGALMALLDLDRYVTLGGLVLGVALGLAIGEATRAALRWSTRGIQTATTPAPILRPRAWQAVALALVIATASLFGVAPRWLGQRLLQHASATNGAEITAQNARVNVFTGHVLAHGVSIADPGNLSRDSLRIGTVQGSLRVGHLLRGRLHVDSLQMHDIEANQLRPVSAAPLRGGRTVAESSVGAPYRRTPNDGSSTVDLERYLSDSGAVAAWCQAASRLAAELESLRPARPAGGPTPQPSRLALRQRRSTLGRSLPSLLVKQIHCEGLPASWKLGQQAAIQLANVTSDPRRSGLPTRALIIAPATGLAVEAHLNLHDSLRPHDLRIQSHDLRPQMVCNLQRLSEMAVPSELAACVAGQGWFDRERIDVQLVIAAPTTGLQLRADRPLAGLPAQLWKDAAQELDRLELPLQLTGSLTRPRLILDPQAARQRFQQQLADAGQTGWSQAIADELAIAVQLAARPQPQVVHPVAETAQVAEASPPVNAEPEKPQVAETPSDMQEPVAVSASPAAVAPDPVAVRRPQPALAQAVPVAPVTGEPVASGALPSDPSPTVDPSQSSALATGQPPAQPNSGEPVLQPVAPVEPAPELVAAPQPTPDDVSPDDIRAAIAQRRMPGLKGMQFGFDREATAPQLASAPQVMPPTTAMAAPAPMPDARMQDDASPSVVAQAAPPAATGGDTAAPRRWFSGLRNVLPFGGGADETQPAPPRETEQVASRPPQVSGVPSPAAPSATAAPAQPGERQPVSAERSWKFWR